MSKRERKRRSKNQGISIKRVSSEYLAEQRKIENRSNALMGDPDFATFFQNERTLHTIDPSLLEESLDENHTRWCAPLGRTRRGKPKA